MKVLKHTYFGILLLATLTACLISCTSKTVCPTEAAHIPAEIASLSGPENLKIGEQATITVAVRNSSLLCVKEANATFTNKGLDTLLVSAALSYTNEPVPADCDCKRDSIIYTLLHFTPLNEGNYRIITGKESVANVQPTDANGFTINVE
jgi:hypothetical protein